MPLNTQKGFIGAIHFACHFLTTASTQIWPFVCVCVIRPYCCRAWKKNRLEARPYLVGVLAGSFLSENGQSPRGIAVGGFSTH